MRNRAFQRALLSLAHPVSIGALIVLLLNDHVWRRIWPSWFTGKIGDFAWLIFAPFLLAAILAWLMPPRLPRRDERVGQFAIVITGLVFGLAKTVPAFHAATLWVLETLTGWPSTLRLDPTDLLALPVLLIARHIWIQAQKRPLPSRGWVLLPLAALATMANQPAVDYGITGLEISGSTIFVTDTKFYSEDGGLSWQGESYGANDYARRDAWTLPDPNDPRMLYRFTPGISIERSEDGGQTWHVEIDLRGDEARLAYLTRSGKSYYRSPAGPLDAVVHPPSGNVVAAMGHEGVLVRTRDGTWHWVAVGEYSVPELNRVDQVISLLSSEIWLSVALIGFTVGTITRRQIRRSRLRDTVPIAILVLVWIGWGFTVLGVRPAIASRGFGEGELLAIPVTVIAILLGLIFAIGTWKRSRGAVAPLAGIAAIGSLLFLLPFVLWSQGSIPFYGTASLVAIALVAATLFAGRRHLRRYIKDAPASGGDDDRGIAAQSTGG